MIFLLGGIAIAMVMRIKWTETETLSVSNKLLIRIIRMQCQGVRALNM